MEFDSKIVEELTFVDYVVIAKSLISHLDLDSLVADGVECDAEHFVISSENFDRVFALATVFRCLTKYRPLPF